jgi:hypothetical protein
MASSTPRAFSTREENKTKLPKKITEGQNGVKVWLHHPVHMAWLLWTRDGRRSMCFCFLSLLLLSPSLSVSLGITYPWGTARHEPISVKLSHCLFAVYYTFSQLDKDRETRLEDHLRGKGTRAFSYPLLFLATEREVVRVFFLFHLLLHSCYL